MGSKIEYTELLILDAIKGSSGIISVVSKRLDCDWHTARKYANLYDSCKEALLDESERVLDLAESALYKSIQTGNTQDAKWLLAVKGKKRGFNEKTEINLNIKEDNEFKIVKKIDADS